MAFYEDCSHGSVTQLGENSGYEFSQKILQDLIDYIQVNL